jgi:hypothetical protein
MSDRPQDIEREAPSLTTSVPLPDGQKRLRALIVHIAEECREAPRFGLVKLNKILWKADYSSFAERGRPITGRAYQRLKWGPAPVEMKPLLREMFEAHEISYSDTDFGDGVIEQRIIPEVPADVRVFLAEELRYVDRAISYYWDKTGTESSDDSHGVAWKTRSDGDPMPYELAYLSDRPLEGRQLTRLLEKAAAQGWKSY